MRDGAGPVTVVVVAGAVLAVLSLGALVAAAARVADGQPTAALRRYRAARNAGAVPQDRTWQRQLKPGDPTEQELK